MEEYMTITLNAEDRFGSSGISFEGLDFLEAKDRALEFLEYIYRSENFVNVAIEMKAGRSTVKRIFEKVRFLDAVDRVSDFLAYVYKEEGEEKVAYETYLPEWVDERAVQDLSQSEKVLLLLRNEHAKGWIRSQDIQAEYERVYGEKIKLSSLSTYLARFYTQEILQRRGSRAQREYRISSAGLAKI